jgi:hypothetical protein
VSQGHLLSLNHLILKWLSMFGPILKLLGQHGAEGHAFDPNRGRRGPLPRPTKGEHAEGAKGREEPSETGRRWIATPPAALALVGRKEGASSPVVRRWRSPTVAAAD